MIPHGFAADDKEAALKAVNAGVDMEMVSYTFVNKLPELVKEGKVKEETINEAVRNILRIKYRLGLFDHPYVDEKKPSVPWLLWDLWQMLLTSRWEPGFLTEIRHIRKHRWLLSKRCMAIKYR